MWYVDDMFTKYLDPKNDLAFKKVFGQEKHKNIPIDFLNATLNLEGDRRIIDLKFLNTHQQSESRYLKESYVDVLVEDQEGHKYIIEMQVAYAHSFEERCQYYAAKTFCAHLGPGQQYKHLRRVISLAITDHIIFPNKPDYKSVHLTTDIKTHENDLQAFSFTFVELPKFTKTLDQLETIEDKWYYFLKHSKEFGNLDEILTNHPEIKEAYEILEKHHWTPEELYEYDYIVKKTLEVQGQLEGAYDYGHRAGHQAGHAVGHAVGHAEGHAEGHAKGQVEGAQQEKKRLALLLIESGQPEEEVARITGLSSQEIQSSV